MKTRQNPLSKIESLLQRMVERPFALLFPSRLQPAQVLRRLEREMEDQSLLQGEGRRLAPEIYDIYLSFKDHQQLNQVEATLKRDWQDHLVQYARQHHYTLRIMPVLRLHPSSELRSGEVRIEAQLIDKEHMGPDGEGGFMATQAISADQLAMLRAQMSPAQPPGISNPGMMPPAQYGYQAGGASSPNAAMMPPTPMPVMPAAWLTINLPPPPQAGQKVYRIEKPVVKVGRQLDNDIIVEDKRVSRYHAQIKYQPDGQFTVYDL
ncbi:MAG TPA: DUF3662 and FHA domain-containing protein, partial [Ktedonobacteraceae bacterium]|nr:DUF3662 and FHA domain-containing protein [Ktedonobacteraceae bacterium]